MNDINKLPRWAQYEISKLQNLVAELKRQIDDGSTTDTNVRWNGGLMDYHYLPNNSRLEFFLPGRGRIDVQHWHDGTLRISGDVQISVIPQASNTVIVKSIE